MKFVDVKNDVAFRKIFGNENRKEVLISFLNAVLMLENDHKIISVDILTPFQLPAFSTGKVTILDVKAVDQRQKNYLIEMQVAKVDGLHKRVLYYASKSYSSQIDRGELYKKLNPVFFIGILDFAATQNKGYISRHKIMDVDTGENYIKDIEFNFIELPKFNKHPTELTSIIEQWVYFIKNAENLEVIPEDVTDEGLKSAYVGAEQHNWTKAELEAYDKVSIREQDDRGRITCAVREKEEEMMEKARQKEEEMAKEFRRKEEETAKEFRRKEEEMAKEFRQEKEEMAKEFRQEKEEMAKEFRQEKEEMAKEFRRKEEETAKEFRRKEEENAEKNLNTAKVFLNLGVSIEDTAKASGLTVEEVKKLQNKK